MIIRFEGCELDLERVVLRRDGDDVRIEPQVFDVLRFLIEHRGKVVRKEELLDGVWGDRFVSESALTTRIKSARQAVGDDGARQSIIRTVHGRGYEFVADIVEIDPPEPVDEPAGSNEPPTTSTMPPSIHRLIGRVSLLEELTEAQRAHRLITLVGPGGVGKTSVGYELARTVADQYGDGVYVVELVTVVDEITTVGALATSLEVNTRHESSIEDAIVGMLRPRQSLIVLDNCEHVVESVAALVDRILRAAPRVSIVATSREPLAVAGEHVWTVAPFVTTDLEGLPLDELATVPAIELFLERAQAADPRFVLDGATAPAVVEICRRLDGIPLAIELAASRASSVDVVEVARRLDERFRLLKGVRRGADPRHQTLHDAISWSYDLLDEDEQQLFASLAVFAGQFDLAAAEAVCRGDDVLDLLTRLANRSMLVVRRPAQGGIRYEMLETLRDYGRNQLGDSERVALFGGHADWFASVARSVEADLASPREHEAVRRADSSFADLRVAQRFAVQTGDVDAALGMVASLREYGMRTLRYEVFTWADSVAGLDAGGHALAPIAAGVRAYGAWVRGEFDVAGTLAKSAAEAEVESGIEPTGLVERVLANLQLATGEVEAGIASCDRMIEVAVASGRSELQAHAYYMASIGLSSTGDYDTAQKWLERSRAAAQHTGSPTDLALSWVAQGFAMPDDADAALDAFATADRMARSVGNRWLSAFARTESSGLLVREGRLDDGRAGLAETVDTWYRAGEWAQQWHTMSRCVIALNATAHYETAAQLLGAIEAHAVMGGPPVMTTLRDLAFEARDEIVERLGETRSDELRAEGAAMAVDIVVDRARNALLGRTLEK